MENIKKEIQNSNLLSAIDLLVKQIEIDESNRQKEIKNLTTEVNLLKNKVKTLEKINSSLLKEKNLNLVKEYSAKLVDLIDTNDLAQFKELIEEHDYPINEFISEEYSDLVHMNMLHYVIQSEKINFMKFLLERGADVNISDRDDQWTPIMYAIQKQNLGMIHILLERGASLDYKDVDGFTPLSVAVDTNNNEVIHMLLKAKPKIDNAKEIMAMAEPYDNKEVIESLKEYFGFQLILYEDN